MSKPCGQCNGTGEREVEEDGRLLMDACYHCGNTGVISDDEAFHDRFDELVHVVAAHRFEDLRQRQRDEEDLGEGWEFAAAESGCSLHAYETMQMWICEDQARSALEALRVVHHGEAWVLRALVDLLVPEKEEAPSTPGAPEGEWVDLVELEDVPCALPPMSLLIKNAPESVQQRHQAAVAYEDLPIAKQLENEYPESLGSY